MGIGDLNGCSQYTDSTMHERKCCLITYSTQPQSSRTLCSGSHGDLEIDNSQRKGMAKSQDLYHGEKTTVGNSNRRTPSPRHSILYSETRGGVRLISSVSPLWC